MKLAFCLFKYFPFGGLQRDFLRIAKECMRRGHEIEVFTMDWQGDSEGLKINSVKTSGLQNHTRKSDFVDRISPQLKRFDLVIGFNKMPGLDIYYAADTCYAAKAHNERSFWYRCLPRYHQGIAFESAVFAKNKHTHILLISKRQQQEFTDFYQTEETRFHLLPPGISRDRMRPHNAEAIRKVTRSVWTIKENELLVLLVGSGFKTKGLDRALLALSALPQHLKNRVHFFVIGEDKSSFFERLAHKLNLTSRVKFLGGRHDVADFLWAADVLIHPAYNENTGTVLLEAMVAGLPVLVTDVCGYADYIRDANAGVVLPSPFKQQELDVVLAHMLASKDDRVFWQENAVNFAKDADIFSLPNRAVDIIESLKPVVLRFDRRTQSREADYGSCDQVGGRRGLGFPALSFHEFMGLEGETYRKLEGRKTIRTIINNQSYFIKQHFGVGWREIFKNLVMGRLPILGAKNEWIAIHKLQSLGIKTPEIVAFGSKGWNPACLQSFILTKELKNTVSLEDFCRNWRNNPPSFRFKKNLLQKIAHITRTMHENGINHRDFYICHFLLDLSKLEDLQLYLIDLHRAACRKKTRKRWLIKDLAGLYFSSLDLGLTRRDLLRFMREYRQMTLSLLFNKELKFWAKVKYRGDKLYRKQQQFSEPRIKLGNPL